MRLFLDTTVLLAASASHTGASREIFNRRNVNHWELIATPYVLDEVHRNLVNFPPDTSTDWDTLRRSLVIRSDVFTLDRPAVFGPAKDRPILFGALAWADVLLTLDRNDFGGLMERMFYSLAILKPGVFLEHERRREVLR